MLQSLRLEYIDFLPTAEHVVGTFETGSTVAQKLLIKSRLQAGIVNVVMMKKILNLLTKYCIDTEHTGIKLM